MRVQRRRVAETAELVQHLGNAVVCEHSDFVDVMEFTKVFAVETGPQICDEYLRTLKETHSFSVEACLITEAGKVLGYQIDQASSGVVGVVDAVDKAASEFL